MSFTNKEIAHILRSVAAVYLLKGENRFRVLAYERAADTVEHMSQEVKDVRESGNLSDLSGIGESIADHIDEYFTNPENSYFAEVLAQQPESLYELMKVPGLGPKRAHKLVRELDIKKKETALVELEKVCKEGKVKEIENFGEKSQAEILRAIKFYRKLESKQKRMSLNYAHNLAQSIKQHLKKHPKVKRIDFLGSLRRWVPTIGDIDVAAVCHPQDAEEVIEHFVSYPNKSSIEEKGKKKSSVVNSVGKRIDLRIAQKKTYGSMLQYFTGSKDHNIQLREFALKKGFSLSEYGIKPLKKSTKALKNLKNYNAKKNRLEFEKEKEFYNFLGLVYIEPELREARGEIEAAEHNKLPDLVKHSDIKGDLHIHSSYKLEPSHDLGEDSYEALFKKGRELNYQYVGFCDHNPSVSNHSNRDIEKILKERRRAIEQASKAEQKLPQYFVGLEVDILPEGNIALPEAGFGYVDFITISIHSLFGLERKKMTIRILKALDHQKVKILGHPTGRLLGEREEIDVEWDKIFEKCKEKKIALEINSWPQRLDLPDNLVRKAVKKDVKIAINTDSHQIDEMDNVRYGVSVARRGWAEKSDIINSWNYKKVKKWIDN